MRLHALLLLRLALLTPAALAPNAVLAATALAQLPEATVQSLRSSLSTTSSSGLEALQRRLEELQTELRPTTSGASAAQQAAQAPGSARALRPASAAVSAAVSQAQGHRAALGPLRGQVMAEIEALHQVAGEASRAPSSTALASLRTQVQARFDRLEAALLAVETARGEAAVAEAQRALAALVVSLQAPTPALPPAPVPTLSPLHPQLQAPGGEPASTSLPRYAIDSLSTGATRSAALSKDTPSGFGYVRASATLPPVAADTATDCSAVAADLADDGVEVQLTPEIRALAQELQYSPVRMLRWMQTEVRYEPYWGSLKGAVGVLQTRSGNATDQASLLVALLRSANTPARFVRGTVGLLDQAPSDNPNSVVQRWLGTKNYSASRSYLNTGGVTAGAFILGNAGVHGLYFEHVWVQACVPFAAYRGNLADAGGYRWVAMDAAIKDHDYQAGLNVGLALDAGFFAPYLAGRSLQLPPDYLAERIEAAARAMKSDASAEDVPYRGRPRALRLDVLPAAPPFSVFGFSNWPGSSLPETARVPEEHRHRFAISVRNQAGTELTAASVSLPQKAFGKITLSYAPDAASQALWNSWGGALAALPAGSVKVYPRIQLDGVTVASGAVASAMPLGTAHKLVMKLSQGERKRGRCDADSGNPADPKDADVTCHNKTVYHDVKAGAYHALGFNAGQTSDAMLAERARRLAEQVNLHPSAPTPASGAGYDATVGELLHIVLQSYIHETERADRRIAELKGMRSASSYDIGLTGSDLRTDYVFDLPLSVRPAGVFVDFKGGTFGFAKIDSAVPLLPAAGETDSAFEARRLAVMNAEQFELAKLSIYATSALEHHVWQQALRTDAVSTVRGMQFAAENGIPLVEFNSANIAQYDSLMQMSGPGSMAAYKARIQEEVAAGAVVTVPRAQIAYTDPVDPTKAWRGVVYMTANTAIGRFSALINGSLSGGFPLLNRTPVGSVYAGNPNAPSFVDLSQGGNGRLVALPTGKQGSNPQGSFAGDPVNMLTGHFTHNESDLRIKGRGGLPIVFERWYNSGAPKDGPLGFGWTHSFNHQLRLYGVENGVAKVGWVNGSGGESFFSSASHSGGDITRGSTLANSPGIQVQFTRIAGGADDGKFLIRERHGLSYLFASASGPGGTPTAANTVTARLLAITDRNGNQLSLGYNASNQLDKVNDSLGRTVLTLGWTGSRITQLSDLSGRKVIYAYTDGLLTQVTDPLNQLRGYSYYGAADGPQRERRIKRLTLPRGNGIEFEYYSGGQVFRHTPLDTQGQPIPDSALTFHYNPFARESWTVNGRGHRHLFAFDAHGNPLRIEDGAGAEQHYSYDPAKPFNRLSETDSVGRTTRYSYNAQDLLETQTLPSGAVLEYRDYNAFAQPQRIKNARGHWSLLRYDARGNLTDSYSLRAGVVPAAGSQPATADLLAWTRRSYDSAGNLVTTLRVKDFSAITGPSLTQTWSSDKLHLLSLTRAGNRNGSQVSETSPSFSYDTLGRLKSGIDARWYPSSFSYDALDRLSQASDSLGKTRSFRFDANGNLLGSELVDGGRRIDSQALAYDAQDRVERSLDHAGNLSQNAYDEIGQLIARTSADQDRIGIEYDAAGHAVAAFDAEGNRVHSQLDTQGRPLIVTDPNGHQTRYEYWGASSFDGRLRRVSLPAIPGQAAGRAEEYEYDAAGQLTRSRSIAADGSSRRERFNFFDELGRPVRSVGAADDAGQRLQICTKFDTLSRPIEVWAGPSTDTTRSSCDFADALLKRQQTQAWDDFGQLLSKTDALGRIWRYGYDEHGNLASSQSPEQAKLGPTNKTVYAYDPQLNGLLRSRTVPGTGAGAGNTGQSLLYKRNALGQVERVETRDGSGQLLAAYDYRYDAAHRLIGIQDSRGPSLSYQWSPGGRLGRMAMAPALGAPASHSWDFRYDAVGRLSAIVAPNGQSVTLALDAGGRLLERQLGNGMVSRYSWHPEGSLESVEHLAGASTIARSSYGYDLWGQRSTAVNSLSGGSQTLSYGYDALGRLKSVANGTAAQQEGYGFDVFGNRKSKTRGSPVTASWDYQFDAAHQLTQVQQSIAGATSTQALLRFDDNGNLRKLCEGTAVSGTASDCSGSQTSTLSWDGLDQLVGLAKAGTQALSEAYAYDDAGRRLRKSSGGASVTNYVYNGDDIAAEWGGNALNGAPAAVYAHGPGVDEPLMRLTGASGSPDATAAYYVQDGLGSVVALFSAGTAANQTPLGGNTLSTTGDYSAASYPPAHLKDGITVTFNTAGWVAVVANGAAATLSLGSTTAVERIELMAVNNYKPASFVVEVQQSSGGAWQQVASGTGDDFVAWADNSSARAVKSFPTAMASAIRVRFTGAVNSGLVWLTEWQVWSAGGSAVTQGFDAWGQVLQGSGSIPTYGYTGREPDASGLMFYRARYYHPGLGQFISRDPLGLAAGINPYAYADGNPVMFTDPEGLLPAKPGGSFSSYWGQINGTTRLGGLFGMVGGGAEMMAGGATFLLGLGASTTGVGAMVGVPAMAGGGLVATHGLDTFQAGTRQLMSGQATGTLTSQALQAMGASEGTAGLIDAGIGVVGSAGMGGLARGTERALMTGLTSDVVSKFAASPAMATGVLKQGQVRAVHNNPSLTAPMFGNAVEIQVANRLASNPILSSSFSHLSAPGRVAPDFASRLTGQTFDITTNTTRSFADHLARPYGSGLNIVPYDRPAGFSFP